MARGAGTYRNPYGTTKELYVVRHTQLDEQGVPTPGGIAHAQAVGALLPKFEVVISGGDPATDQTAMAMAGHESMIDKRAGMSRVFTGYEQEVWQYEGPPKKLSVAEYISFSFMGGIVSHVVNQHAGDLKRLIHETLNGLDDGQNGLIVSNGLWIMAAMYPMYLHKRPIMHCYGFRLQPPFSRETMRLFEPPEAKVPH